MPTRPQIDAGRDDRAVGLGADGERREARRHRRRRARARAAGVAVERVGVARQAAARAPAAGASACERKLAHSLRLVLPRITAPAVAQPLHHDARRAARATPSSASEPAVVLMRSAVAMLSLSSTGMPCSGPRTRPALALGVERARRSPSASGFSSITLCSVGPARSIASMRAEVVRDEALRREPALGHRRGERDGAGLFVGERSRRDAGGGHERCLEGQQRSGRQQQRATLHGGAGAGACPSARF